MIFQPCYCRYCLEYDFPLLWKLEDNVVWFEIPKNGSSSIKDKYPQRRVIYSDQQQNGDEIRLVVLRDPVDRFTSIFKHCCFLSESEYNLKRVVRMAAFFSKFGKDLHQMSTPDRLVFFIDHIEDMTSDEEVHHFYPQSYFVDLELPCEFNIIDMGELSRELGVQHINKSSDVHIQMSDDQIEHIKAIYQSDYALFEEFK